MLDNECSEPKPWKRKITVSNGSIEWIKWLALICMTVDHANRFFMVPASYNVYCVGRLAMPLFCFAFAYNLARPQFDNPAPYLQSFKRLVFFGLLAIPPYGYMLRLPSIFPLNILFTFAVALMTLYLQQGFAKNRLLSIMCFLLFSFFVEYSWAGVLLCIAFWLLCKQRYCLGLILTAIAFYILSIINENSWALLALPVIVFFSSVDCRCLRLRYFFWIYYPAHLWVFMSICWLIKG